ncbi:NC domain-containing protein [[Phormidium ambiguum] IAM M-71]|uniref:NC domain-containing protein n=1 Tax=[Phormidium ambiguum] IAM M-71 TaxID=454136 RepID=A0A1U7IQJ8_9CYAN|nr:lecithin retinol acyltransferase family protein [Phormidium ambiguum]OKH39690.1 NC domain-containing protein [Phormidium ambiguum IAM M-71]
MARGDQIYAMRHFVNIKGVYEHHGIDCGDGTAIHYRKPSETIERTSLETLAQGSIIYVKRYQTSFIPDVVIHRAETRLGERKYNLLFNNCEHFATWCKTGINYSQQVVNFIPMLRYIDIDSLSEPVNRSLETMPKDRTTQLVEEALSQIRTTWNNIQPQYTQTLKEMNDWEKVAKEALKRNREDLARAALQKKQKYKQDAIKQEEMLQKLAKMTQNLIEKQRENQQI